MEGEDGTGRGRKMEGGRGKGWGRGGEGGKERPPNILA